VHNHKHCVPCAFDQNGQDDMGDQEQTWINAARRGDEDAFGNLVELYQRPVFNLCYRMLGTPMAAEDAAQETFLRAYVHLSSYDVERSFSSWLLSIASHYCIDQLRRKHHQLLSLDGLTDDAWSGDAQAEPEEVVLDREKERAVNDLLQRLPADYRAAVVLRYWYDMSYDEIARLLDTTVSAIKSRLFRARQMLARSNDPASDEPASRRTLSAPAASGTSRPGVWAIA
jgi:RNA polymerase sigma-70 factor (ECF subfamily)